MSQYHSLFNSTRLPVLQAQDELVGYESSDQSRYGHVLVLKNDNFYTVPAVQDDGEWEGYIMQIYLRDVIEILIVSTEIVCVRMCRISSEPFN